MTFRPTVTAMEHEKRLEWLGRVGFPGVFDGRHSFRLEAQGEGWTRLTQAEEFSGVLVPLMGTVLGRTRAGFESMNESLRLVRRAKWPSGHDGQIAVAALEPGQGWGIVEMSVSAGMLSAIV